MIRLFLKQSVVRDIGSGEMMQLFRDREVKLFVLLNGLLH